MGRRKSDAHNSGAMDLRRRCFLTDDGQRLVSSSITQLRVPEAVSLTACVPQTSCGLPRLPTWRGRPQVTSSAGGGGVESNRPEMHMAAGWVHAACRVLCAVTCAMSAEHYQGWSPSLIAA